MQHPPPPYQKMANRVDLDLDLEAGRIINQQPTGLAETQNADPPKSEL
jgi:hypothetical protein